MIIRFLPEGGFQKSGGIVEIADSSAVGQNKTVYEILSFALLTLDCSNFKYGSKITVSVPSKVTENEADHENISNQEIIRSIRCTGVIREGKFGSYRLSNFGETKRHSELSVEIVESRNEEFVWLEGQPDMDEVEFQSNGGFYLTVFVSQPRFRQLVEDLSHAGSNLVLRLDAGAQPNLFAEWSPLDRERGIKYLCSKTDIENYGDVPDEFWERAKKEVKDEEGLVSKLHHVLGARRVELITSRNLASHSENDQD